METNKDWIPCYMFDIVPTMADAKETARRIDKVASETKSGCEAYALPYGLTHFCVTIEGETKEEIQALLVDLKAAGIEPVSKPS